MSYLVVLIVDDPEDCRPILSGWENAGVSGVTILESTGLGRFKKAGLLDDIPLLPSLSDILSSGEIHHRTLLSVVDEQKVVDEMVAIAQGVIGDLDEKHTGFLFVVPVIQAYGLRRGQK